MALCSTAKENHLSNVYLQLEHVHNLAGSALLGYVIPILPSNSSEYTISFFIMWKLGCRSISFHATWRNPSLCNNWAREVSLIPEICGVV